VGSVEIYLSRDCKDCHAEKRRFYKEVAPLLSSVEVKEFVYENDMDKFVETCDELGVEELPGFVIFDQVFYSVDDILKAVKDGV
jgi:hypothetical protein